MNRRGLAYPQDQWIRVTVEDGPFHRQYRHQQNGYRDLGQRRPDLDARRAESTSTPPNGLTQQNRLTRRSVHSDLPDKTHRMQQRGNHPPVNGGLHSKHTNSKRKGVDFLIQHNLMRPAVKHSLNGDSNRSNVTTKRVLWLRSNDNQRPKVVTLLDRFGNAGLEVQVFNVFEDHEAPTGNLSCALIMLECVDTLEQEMLARLDSVRSKSKAPLIILTDNATLDWSLLALREGADAIFTLNTPDDIILARSNALLRRWTVE